MFISAAVAGSRSSRGLTEAPASSSARDRSSPLVLPFPAWIAWQKCGILRVQNDLWMRRGLPDNSSIVQLGGGNLHLHTNLGGLGGLGTWFCLTV